MKELDENKIYDLSELTSEQWDLLKPILNKNSISKFQYKTLEDNFRDGYRHIYFNLTSDWVLIHNDDVENYSNIVNAKALFYTLENIQVNYEGLSDNDIEQMKCIVKKRGYVVNNGFYKNPKYIYDFVYFKLDLNNEFYFGELSVNKTTITYEKFMELFGNKEKSEEFNNLVDNNSGCRDLIGERIKEMTGVCVKNDYNVGNSNIEPNKEFKNLVEVLNEELTEKAYKETSNKLNYELDFNFITQLAERMAQNKHKYEPYNWQKLDNIAELKQALYRHVMEVMKGNYADDNRLFGHLESIAINAMFINYQLNKGSN